MQTKATKPTSSIGMSLLAKTARHLSETDKSRSKTEREKLMQAADKMDQCKRRVCLLCRSWSVIDSVRFG